MSGAAWRIFLDQKGEDLLRDWAELLETVSAVSERSDVASWVARLRAERHAM